MSSSSPRKAKSASLANSVLVAVSAKPRSAEGRLETKAHNPDEFARWNRYPMMSSAKPLRASIRMPPGGGSVSREKLHRMPRLSAGMAEKWVNGSGGIVSAMRTADYSDLDSAETRRLRQLVTYFETDPAVLTEPVVLYRFVGPMHPTRPTREALRYGVSDAAFIATSRDPQLAADFSGSEKGEPGNSLLSITVPAGTPVLPVGRGHDEIVLPPGTFTANGPDHFVTGFVNDGVLANESQLWYELNRFTPVTYTPSASPIPYPG